MVYGIQRFLWDTTCSKTRLKGSARLLESGAERLTIPLERRRRHDCIKLILTSRLSANIQGIGVMRCGFIKEQVTTKRPWSLRSWPKPVSVKLSANPTHLFPLPTTLRTMRRLTTAQCPSPSIFTVKLLQSV